MSIYKGFIIDHVKKIAYRHKYIDNVLFDRELSYYTEKDLKSFKNGKVYKLFGEFDFIGTDYLFFNGEFFLTKKIDIDEFKSIKRNYIVKSLVD